MAAPLLTSNVELYRYVASLAEALRGQDFVALADRLETANRFIDGSASEYFHELHLVLEDVIAVNPSGIAMSDVQSVVDQINAAFSRVGGA